MRIILKRSLFSYDDRVNEGMESPIRPSHISKEDFEIFKKLEDRAKRQGTRVYEISKGTEVGPAFLGNSLAKRVSDKAKRMSKEDRDLRNRSWSRKLGLVDKKVDVINDVLGKDSITVGKRKNHREEPHWTNISPYLAHEIGHSDYTNGRVKGLEGKIGKALHSYKSSRVAPYIKKGTKIAVPVITGALVGTSIGPGAGLAEVSGNVVKGLGVTLLSSGLSELPELGCEYYATKRGLDILKESGASKEYLEAAKRSLKAARGSYVREALSNQLGPAALYIASLAPIARRLQ